MSTGRLQDHLSTAQDALENAAQHPNAFGTVRRLIQDALRAVLLATAEAEEVSPCQ